MKILTLVFSIGPGGTERAAVNYAIGYNKLGHDSKVLVIGEGNERAQDLVDAGVETLFLINQQDNGTSIFRQLAYWRPDIIHVHNFGKWLLPYIDKIKNEHTKVVETNVFSRPHYEPEYRNVSLSMQLSAWGCWKYATAMKGAAYSPQIALVPYTVINYKFTAPSEKEKKAFLQLHGIPEGAFIVGRLGQAHPSKWDIRILAVIEKITNENDDIYWLFAGMPDNIKKQLRNMSADIQSKVKIIDHISGDTDLALYYHSLDCFAHISLIGESFGYVLAEAIICKVPIVTLLTPFKDNAQFEVVGHEYGGICTTSIKQFTKAVFRLYNLPAERERIKKNQEEWIEKRFAPEIIIPLQIDIYKKILAGEKYADNYKYSAEVVKSCLQQLYGIYAPFLYAFLKIANKRISIKFLSNIKKLVLAKK